MKAVPLLLLGVVVFYGWALFPPELQSRAWNISGSFARAALLVALVWHVRERMVLAVAGWWLCEELLVMGCNTAFMVAPWPIRPGDAACSSLLQFDLGKIGLVWVVLMLALLPRRG